MRVQPKHAFRQHHHNAQDRLKLLKSRANNSATPEEEGFPDEATPAAAPAADSTPVTSSADALKSRLAAARDVPTPVPAPAVEEVDSHADRVAAIKARIARMKAES